MSSALVAAGVVLGIGIGIGLVAYALGTSLAIDLVALCWILLLLTREPKRPKDAGPDRRVP